MEAMWSRFLPAYVILRDLLGEQRVGDPRLVEADFGFRRDLDPAHRLFDLALGGGALLDLGIYTAQLVALVLGHPDRVVADGHIGETGVDEQVAAVLHHPGGRLGVIKAAIRTGLSCSARISGTDGWIEIPPFMHAPDHLVVGAAGSHRAHRRAVGGRGPAVPGHRGAPLPAGGADREPGHAARRDAGAGRARSTTSAPRSASPIPWPDRNVLTDLVA